MEKEKIERIKEIVVLVVIIILLLIILFLIVSKGNKKEEVVSNGDELSMVLSSELSPNTEEENSKEIYIDVKGSVKKPGVYKVKEGTIINDVIKLAGGIKGSGTTKNINLSKKVEDEMVLYIYTTSELKKNSSNVVSECVTKTEYIDTCQNSSIITTSDNTETGKININTSGVDGLMTLSGIGEAKALAIIDYRNKNGNFKSIEEIMNVSGIGEAAYQKIKDYITI